MALKLECVHTLNVLIIHQVNHSNECSSYTLSCPCSQSEQEDAVAVVQTHSTRRGVGISIINHQCLAHVIADIFLEMISSSTRPTWITDTTKRNSNYIGPTITQ